MSVTNIHVDALASYTMQGRRKEPGVTVCVCVCVCVGGGGGGGGGGG